MDLSSFGDATLGIWRRSAAERLLPPGVIRGLLLRPYLPGLRTQVPVLDGRGWPIARLDLAEEELMLAVEADGKRGHAGSPDGRAGPTARRSDRAVRWRTERVTWFELRRDQDTFVRRILASAQYRRRRAA